MSDRLLGPMLPGTPPTWPTLQDWRALAQSLEEALAKARAEITALRRQLSPEPETLGPVPFPARALRYWR